MDEELSKGIEPIEEMLKSLNVNSVFGAPIKEGEVTIIPVARVSYMFGAGAGYGRGPGESEGKGEEEAAGSGEGAGSGGGGAGMARPVGYIRIGADGAAFEPTVDATRISLCGIGLWMWLVFWITKTVRAFVPRR
jgi:uncharacterized spore protein YtfJ